LDQQLCLLNAKMNPKCLNVLHLYVKKKKTKQNKTKQNKTKTNKTKQKQNKKTK